MKVWKIVTLLRYQYKCGDIANGILNTLIYSERTLNYGLPKKANVISKHYSIE